MVRKSLQASPSNTWMLARAQHGVITRSQLLERGYSRTAIEHRLAKGRLHPLHAGVYAVGFPELSRHGHWIAAVLACGPEAALSHASAAALFGFQGPEPILTVSVDSRRAVRRPGLQVHRVEFGRGDTGMYERIPVTSPARTLIDLATELPLLRLERAVNEADKLGLIDPETLSAELARRPGQRGVPALRDLLDRDAFVLTDSDLEQRFLRIARKTGLGIPETKVRVNGFVVDFLWRDLGLVIETDGLTYHRTPLQQARDRQRDQAHAAAGLTSLRFTNRQVLREPEAVRRTVELVALKLAARAA